MTKTMRLPRFALVGAVLLTAGALALSQPVTGPAFAQDSASYGPQTFTAQRVHVEDFIGTLKFEVVEGTEVTVAGTGTQEELDKITVELNSGAVEITRAQEDRSWWDRWFGDNRWDSDKEMEKFPTFTILIPKGAALEIDGGIGKADMDGNLDGALKVKGVAMDMSFGDVSRADISVAGSGDIVLGDVNGPLEVSIAGSGSFRSGDVADNSEINIAGSGSAETADVRGALEISIAGSGDVTAQSVNGGLEISISGSGDVVVREGRADPFSVSVAGSGDVEFGGTAVDPEVSIWGSGDVSIGKLEGKLKSSGNGSVVIGN